MNAQQTSNARPTVVAFNSNERDSREWAELLLSAIHAGVLVVEASADTLALANLDPEHKSDALLILRVMKGPKFTDEDRVVFRDLFAACILSDALGDAA